MEFLNHVVALSAVTVVLVQQILKLKVVPSTFANKYPVPTNIILSVIASVVVAWQSKTVNPSSWTDWVLLVALTSVLSAVTYNSTLRNWTELRQMESPAAK